MDDIQTVPSGLVFEIPGRKQKQITHVVFDFNGTLAVDGKLIPGVKNRIRQLAERVDIMVLTADTFGTAQHALLDLPLTLHVVQNGKEKRRCVESIGADHVAAIGNGTNDKPMFRAATLSIAICGSEGMAVGASRFATIIVHDIRDAIDLFLKPERMIATLRR